MHRTCYVHIGETNSAYAEPFKGISWFGYGAPDTSYIVPLWPIMRELPKFYETGSRYEEFRRDSGWWVNSYVQQMAELHYNLAIQDIRNYRDPKLEVLYKVTPEVQKIATDMYETDPEAAIDFVSNYAFMNAVAWHEEWKLLGDRLLGNYALGYVNFKSSPYPDWWNEAIGYGFPER
jgi:dipeptidase